MDESGFLSKLDLAVSLMAMTLSAMTLSTAWPSLAAVASLMLTLLGLLPSWVTVTQWTAFVALLASPNSLESDQKKSDLARCEMTSEKFSKS